MNPAHIPAQARPALAFVAGTVLIALGYKSTTTRGVSPAVPAAGENQTSDVAMRKSQDLMTHHPMRRPADPEISSPRQWMNSKKLVRVSTDKAPGAIGPYAQGMKSGGFLYTSGQIAMCPVSGTLVSGTAGEETQQVLANLNAILSAAQVGKDQVVKTTVYLQDMNDYDQMNRAYVAFFGAHKPARSAVEVSKLPKGAKVEIEIIARLETHDVL